jgi:nitrite reductase (NADH) large subunit
MVTARPRLLVIGNGMAGLKLLEELAGRMPGHFDVTVVGAEPEPAYNRVLLSSLLAGEIATGDVAMKSRDWYREHGIVLLTGCAVARLDPDARRAVLADGSVLAFDVCVLATGSQPVRLTMPGHELPGVMTFRTLADIAVLSDHAGRKTPTVVIGGGLLGIEAAYGLARAGAPVTLVHVMDKLMERQLDAEGAALLKTALEARSITVALNANTARILGTGAVEGVELSDGRTIGCGLVVMAVGVRANADLARAAGIDAGRGIQVSPVLQTSHPAVYAIGECAEVAGACYGLVEPAYEQARALAQTLSGKPAPYTGSVLATNLKVSGIPVFSAGDYEGQGAETLVLRDQGQGTYRKFVVRDSTLAGVVLVGDTSDALWYRALITMKTPIAPLRAALAFGRSFAEAA